MINASQEFKNLINSGVKVVNYADITLRDGTVLNLTPEDFALGGFSMTDEMTDGKFGIGYAVGKTIDVTIANHTNKFSSYDFYKSIIYMYVAVELEDGRVLKERKGKYYVINPTSPGDTIRLSGVDSMYLLDKPYKATTSYPATLQNILSDCCLDCGVNIGFKQFSNYNFVVSNKPEDVTYRDVVSYVAQIAGCNARINNDDAMELVWYDVLFMDIDILDGGNLIRYDEADTYDGGNFSNYSNAVLFDGGNFTDPAPENVTKISSLSVSTDEIIISGVKLENDNVEILKGTEEYVVHIKDNPLTIGKEEEIANYLYNKLKGYKFRALSCNIANNPLFESYDACYVYDRKGNYYFTLINSVQYKISGFTTISCKAEDPVRNESSYTSDAAKALVQAKRNTEIQLSNYDKAVQNMNMLASNAMGLYRESEVQSDGSNIYYQSNRPITKNASGKCQFEANSVVYKMTGDGFFVSTNGGKTYTSGFDSNGNAVVNVLSAIGITFDWAKGGTLALGGDNDVDGSMIVHDANGKVIGKFNKDGLWASNGYFKGTIESTNAKITGGYVNIETNSRDYSAIELNYLSYKTELRPSGLLVGNTLITDDLVKVGSDSYYVALSQAKLFLYGSSSSITISPYELSINNANLSLTGNSGSADFGVNVKFSSGVNFSLLSEATFNGKVIINGDFTVDAGGTFSVSRESNFSGKVNVSGVFQTTGTTKLCDGTYDTLSFFGSSGSSKKTVSTIYSTSSADASDCASKINEVINALKGYGLL